MAGVALGGGLQKVTLVMFYPAAVAEAAVQQKCIQAGVKLPYGCGSRAQGLIPPLQECRANVTNCPSLCPHSVFAAPAEETSATPARCYLPPNRPV